MEVALASTVLALTLVGMIGAIESGAQVLELSRKQTVAAQILHGELDQLRLQSWSTVTTSPYTAGPTTLTNANDTVLSGFWPSVQNWSGFSLTRTITCLQPAANPYPYASTPLLLQITFTVQWTGMSGRIYVRNATTYLGRSGLNLSYQRS